MPKLRWLELRPEPAWPFLLWFWLCLACFPTWSNHPDYGHGFFIPLLALFFLHERWHPGLSPAPLSSPPNSSSLPHLLGLFLPVILLVELIRLAPMPWRLPLWLIYGIATGASLLITHHAKGWSGVKSVSFPILLMTLAVPWPVALEVPLSHGLGRAIAWTSGELLQIGGIANQVGGRIIEVARGTLGVEEACSGVRSLHTGIAFALAIGEWHRLRWGRRLGLLGLAVAGAFVINTFRTTFLAAGVARKGPSFLDTGHDAAAWAALVLLCGALWGISMLWRPADKPETPAPKPALPGPYLSFLWIYLKQTAGPLTLSTLALLLLARIWYATGPELSFQPLTDATFLPGTVFEPIPPPSADILKADRAVFLRPSTPASPGLLGYHLVWLSDNGFGLSHRPEVCLPGGGWTPSGPPVIIPAQIGGRRALSLGYVFQRGNQRMNLYWMAWINNRPVTPALHDGASLQRQLLYQLVLDRKPRAQIEVLGLADFNGSSVCTPEKLEEMLLRYGLTD
jgi:exosortase